MSSWVVFANTNGAVLSVRPRLHDADTATARPMSEETPMWRPEDDDHADAMHGCAIALGVCALTFALVAFTIAIIAVFR